VTIVDDHLQVLEDTRVTGYPFVQPRLPLIPWTGTKPSPSGFAWTPLLDLNAYLFKLQALPAWSPTRLRSRGRGVIPHRRLHGLP